MKQYKDKVRYMSILDETQGVDSMIKNMENREVIILTVNEAKDKYPPILDFIWQVGISSKISVAVFSLEMNREQFVNYMLCLKSELQSEKMRTGELKNKEWDNLIHVMKPLFQAPIYLDDSPVTIAEIFSKCKRLKEENNLGMVVIDNIQKIKVEPETLMDELKKVAQELDVPIVLFDGLGNKE